MSDNFISAFFISVIAWLAGVLGGNFLAAVVLFTFIMKLILLPLDIKQRNSTRKMTKLQGKIAEINERYKHDPQQANIKVRELYKKENVSMTAGCLPMLIQLPIIFAMFGAVRMLSSVETVNFVADLASGATSTLPSFGWVHNIWQPDTATANVMPNLAEFSAVFESCKDKLSAETLATITQLLDNSSITQISQTAAILPEGTFFANSVNIALGAVSTNAVESAAAFNYGILVGPILAQHEGFGNGYYIFPLLAGLAMFGSSFITQKINANPATQQQQGNTNMMMNVMMPVMAVFMAASSAVPFSVYWIASSLFTLISQVVMSYIFKRQDSRELAVK